MRRLKRSWHSATFRRDRRKRFAMRVLLLMCSLLTALQIHDHDKPLYGGYRGSDPVTLVVLLALVVFSVWVTRAVW